MKTLFVTGSSGMSAATARLWTVGGGQVFIAGISREECLAVEAELPGAASALCDVREEASVKEAIDACITRFGSINAVFNAAGISARRFGDGPLHECSSAGWAAAIEVHARGTFHVCREVLSYWVEQQSTGVILNMGSVLARSPEPNNFATHAYAASKGAVESLTISAAAYYAPKGIRLNVIAPGLVLTPMSARARENPAILEFAAAKQPLTNGMLSSNAVAKVAIFLLSDESAPITGQVIPVDGGWSVL